MHAASKSPAASPDWSRGRNRLPRHGRHGPRPALRQPVLARGVAAAVGRERGLDASEALAQLKPRFDAKRGTLDWYCIDHWSEELGFDVAALKAEMHAHIRYLPGATDFLDRSARARQARAADDQRAPDQPRHQEPADGARAALRRAGLVARVRRAEGVAGILGAARRRSRRGGRRPRCSSTTAGPCWRRRVLAGVRWLYQVLQPDSTQPPHAAAPGFTGIRALGDLAP